MKYSQWQRKVYFCNDKEIYNIDIYLSCLVRIELIVI